MALLTVNIGTKRFLWVELTSASGTPDDVEIVVRDPSGNEAAYATALSGSRYETTTKVLFDEVGDWKVSHFIYIDGDATNPEDHEPRTIRVVNNGTTYAPLRV